MGSNYEGWSVMRIEIERTEMCCAVEAPDTSTQCIHCGSNMHPEHAHYRCPKCGNRDACCEGVY